MSPVKSKKRPGAGGCTRENRATAAGTERQPRPRSLVVNQKVLAERNQAVVPVGAWVESGQDCQEHPAILALLTEEQQSEAWQEKEESLRRFQEDVRQRVAQQARARKRRQMQTCYETAQHEGRVVQQSCDAARRLTPRKNAFSSEPQGELAICSPGSRWVSAQGLGAENGGTGVTARAFQQQKHQLSKVRQQVRRRLASCQTVPTGEVTSELPGGIWRTSPTRDKPASRLPFSSRVEEEELEEEVPLIGQHDRPVGLQESRPTEAHGSKTVSFHSQQVCERLTREPYPTGPIPGFSTDFRATRVLWPGEDQEELKRQRQSQFLMYRRLFMDIEREQVKEQRRHRQHLRRITRIKADKERQRRAEERRMERPVEGADEREDTSERGREILERLRLEEDEGAQERERKARAQKDKEATRYVEALRARMSERLQQEKAELPPLCCCGEGFWDSHPDTCANNCVFYKNPRGYARALQSVLSCCDLRDGSLGHRASARRIASAHALSPRK
ncbi:coiled-coil domain-containing protein 15 [Amia ocellicauda]|uniref:coiled-coil domain-containing protein 15 n=1 Tax=Amia ocellicauda TaxID=2972642 RepID=UPI00346391FD